MLDSVQVESSDGFGRFVKPSRPGKSWDRHAPPLGCDIEQLLAWTYARQEAHRAKFKTVGGPSGVMDSILRVERNANLGGRQSGGAAYGGLELMEGPMSGADDTHPYAMTVHAAVGAVLDELGVGLVIQHGWQWTRPDWGGPLKLLRPWRTPKGNVKLMYDNSRNAIGCMLCQAEVDHNAAVLFARARYTHWWEALLLLADECGRLLPDIGITGPAAPEAPWKDLNCVRNWLDTNTKID